MPFTYSFQAQFLIQNDPINYSYPVIFVFFVALLGCAPSTLQGYLAHQKHPSLGLYSRLMPRPLWRSYGGRGVLMSEAPLYHTHTAECKELCEYPRSG